MHSFLENTLIACHPLYRSALRLRSKHFNTEKYIYTRLIDKGDFVIEGGANRGYFTTFYAKWVGRRGKVYAFEPVAPTFDRLQKHCAACHCDNLNLIHRALWNQKEVLTMYVPGSQDGQASLAQHDAGCWNEDLNIAEYKTQAIRLDDFVQEQSIKRVDFIKLDLEGAEFQALQGAEDLLTSKGPILHLELENHWMKDFGSSTKDAIQLLKQCGYTNFLLYKDDGTTAYDFEEVLSKTNDIDGNVIAFKEKHQQKLNFFKIVPFA